ncbi:hypothetical protein CIL03_18900 [Virgibacillus indicus]|uniref:DUF4177 domain-containing protein n=1 Tax=Virgibacillus indicus TaxID=2024554 RepID=A0A265N4P1_9BACI|nr:DUF4177 domain-containing protein [Virgibacillus indicus]OZU87010.1 hypothetical protein CIL03_18900 [Virgibacillus indicus]
MYEYKFERISLTNPSMTNSKPVEDYQDIIHKHAEKGWKLVQIFSPSIRSSGTAGYFEIIFEREKRA